MTTPLGASVDSDAGGHGALPGTRFIDPAALARIGNLELVARWVVEGFLSGLHRSPHLGFSTDFSEHRQYVPGDDIRRIDWRVFARTERYYVKEYEADTNTNFMVLLDVSKSMQYGSGPLSKLEYAKYLAACLTYFSYRQRDRVGLISFDDDVRAFVPPSAKHLQQVLHELERATPLGKGSLARPLAKVAESQRRRGVMLVLSDLYEEPDRVISALGPLRDAGHDVVVMQILDPMERSFAFDDAATFEDVETGVRLPVVPSRVRGDYQRLMAAHLATMSKRLGEHRIDYCLVDTAQPLDAMLFEYLLRRERMRTVK
ncbi:MAG: DUF58 domain-containing protein [Gemmatimonadaceae bacterium]|nr:DUF58 domain-containing protein [Gemmatimonadaceae bacterium]